MNIFYSQIGEDILIYNNYINKIKNDGTYIEIGASDGLAYSNTKFFNEKLGFKGILIEPVPELFKELKENRPQDILINAAVDYEEGLSKFIGENTCSGLDKYLSEPLRDKYLKGSKEYLVNTYPISKIIQDSGLKYIDYFSIDVEGGELCLLETMDWTIPVYIITIELNEKLNETNEIDRKKNQKCRDLLIKKGFTFIKKIDINEFWINKNYFRANLLYDKFVPKFNNLHEAGSHIYMAEHVKKDIEKNLNLN
jgi:FkbM family methyltransferase